MATIIKDLGPVSAYAYAVTQGYTGTEEEFAQEMADLAAISAEAETLEPDDEATASYSGGVLSLGIPKGDKGDTGETGATGATGATGNGIASITKTGTSGLVDTYTITFTDGTTSTFTVTNGTAAIDATLSIAGRAADAKATGDEISDLKSAIINGGDLVDTATFVSGARTGTGEIVVNQTRCTTSKVYVLSIGNTIEVKNVDSGLKFAVAGVKNNTLVYDSGWQTSDFAYNVAVDADAWFVNVSKISGANLSPSEIVTLSATFGQQTYISVLSEEIDNLPPYKFRDAVNNGDLIQYQGAEIIEGKYTWGVDGRKINIANNASYKMAVVKVGPNKVYRFPTVSWWGVTDDNDVVVLGCGSNGTSTDRVDTTGYSTASKLYMSFIKSVDAYIIDNDNGNTSFDWSLMGLTVEANIPNNNVFSIPAFKFVTGKEWNLYFDGAWLRKAEYKRTSYGVGQFDDHFAYSVSSAGYMNLGIKLYDNNFDGIGTQVIMMQYVTPNYRNLSALYIGDSTINNGRLTAKVLEVFADNNVTCTLLGTRGTGTNKHEGRSGWTAADYCGLTTRGKDTAQNPFYNPSSEAFDFNYYMTQQGYSAPDFVFIQLGINDMFSVSMSGIDTGYAAYKVNMLAIINSIHSYDANIKIVVNLITMPNGNVSAFNTLYGTNYYNWERRYVDIMANSKLISDVPSYVLLNPHNLILNPMTNITDDVHPTADGYAILGEFDANIMFAN